MEGAVERAKEQSSPAIEQPGGRGGSTGQPRHALGLFLLGIGLAILTVAVSLTGEFLPREGAFMAGIFVLAATLWISEALPLFATSLLVIGLQTVLLANPGGWPGLGFAGGESPGYREILSTAADPVLFLFFGGFVLAQAAVKEGVDRAMSGLLLRPFGGEPKWVLLGFMIVTMCFGMWMSNTATTAMMLALLVPILRAIPPADPFRKALVLCVPLGANISGMGTPIASPPNAVAVGFLRQSGHEVEFLDWMLVAVPLVGILALFAWLVLLWWFAPTTPGLQLAHESEPLTRRGWMVVGVFAVTVVLWMSERWHGLPPSVVAFLPVVTLSMAGILTRKDLGGIQWNIIILIAGGISLGTGMQMTGLDRVIVKWLPGPEQGELWLLSTLVLGTITVGIFMSNTAAANLFLPIGLSAAALSGAEGLHPVQAAISIALAASMSMALPISTPPNALAYGTGEFSTRELAKVTLAISALAAALIIFGGGTVLRMWGVLEVD